MVCCSSLRQYDISNLATEPINIEVYSHEMIIALAFKINCKACEIFRQHIMIKYQAYYIY